MRHQLLLRLLVLMAIDSQAQQFEKLSTVKSPLLNVHYSVGHDQRAESITRRVEKAMTFHEKLLAFRPNVTLLILSEADWTTYTKSNAVYGMPHYTDEKTLIVAAEDNAFWRSFVPPMDQLPPSLAEQISRVYLTDDSTLSMQGFFDLLAIHELAHAFHFQKGFSMQRKWMGELFANIFLHTYIAEMEPQFLPALTLFPQMVVGSGTAGLTYLKLSDVHERYNEIAQTLPRNYAWFQCRWHVGAAKIYDAEGKMVCKKIWDAFSLQKEPLTDEEYIAFLEEKAGESVADLVKNWETP